jgi:hypothetical protein
MLGRQQVIHERSNIIPINNFRNDNQDYSQKNLEYSLKQNWFDPTKNSPPNDFMIKLYSRLHMYEKSTFHMNDFIEDKK